MLRLNVASDVLRLADPLRVSGYSFDTWEVVLATLDDGTHRGRGEASGIYFLGDDATHMRAAIEEVRTAVESEPSRDALRSILPPGGARNAIDCALWELEAARSGKPVWELAGVPEPRLVTTTFTLSADSPEAMARIAAGHAGARAIKAKLGKEPRLHSKIDPTLLGGLIVKVGSRMIDSSLRTKLDGLRAAMKGN